MSLAIIKIDNGVKRAALAAAAVFVVVTAVFAAKWNFASSASTRVDKLNVAEMVTGLGPDDPQTHYALAVLLDKTFEPGDAERALGEYKETTRLLPNNYLAWLALGKAYERSGDTASASDALKQAFALAPNYADVQWAYGNFMLRSGDDQTAAFEMIRRSVGARPSYAGPAAITAMQVTDDDVAATRKLIGDSGPVNAALSSYLLTQKRYDEAGEAWSRLPSDERKNGLKDAGRNLATQAIAAGKYRLAASVFADIGTDPPPAVGTVTNGGFESGVRLSGANELDWQIAAGTEPQISLSDRGRSGKALFIIFNTSRAADFRVVRQTIAVEPGASYVFEAFYRTELRTDATAHFEIADAGGTQIIATVPSFGLNADWLPVSAAFTVPASMDGISVRLVRDTCPSSVCAITGKLLLDDISLRRQ